MFARPAATAVLVYSVSTGAQAEVLSDTLRDQFLLDTRAEEASWDQYYEPFCFVCGRATDHFAEHDDLVDQGLASYDRDGYVHVTEAGHNAGVGFR